MAGLDQEAWHGLDRMAALHRLQPLLHHHHRADPAIPDSLRAGWAEAYRASALASLVLAADLTATTALLEQAGMAPLALKGAWLAWHAYPHPALRPMRDLDLLLTPDTVIPAFELLQAHGYRQEGAQHLTLEETVRLDKHMPPLVSPRGTVIELHQRLWEVDGRMDHAAPAAREAAIRARAIRSGPLAYLAPQDTLAHLVIHAVYDHRLDCGPLVLSDIAFLLAAAPVDWDAFWAEARAGGWQRGAGLVLALVKVHAPDAQVTLPADLPPCPADLADLSTGLLLQELDTRQSAGVAATLTAAGPGAFLRRILARRKGADDVRDVTRDLSSEGGFAAWAGMRLVRTVRDLARREVRDQSRDLARLSRWLDA
nr:nucleotidyltransferase family protein [Novosphingobium flavum]